MRLLRLPEWASCSATFRVFAVCARAGATASPPNATPAPPTSSLRRLRPDGAASVVVASGRTRLSVILVLLVTGARSPFGQPRSLRQIKGGRDFQWQHP